MACGRRRTGTSGPKAPIVAMALVLVIALASAAVWVAYAVSPLPAQQAEPAWWSGMGAVPTR